VIQERPIPRLATNERELLLLCSRLELTGEQSARMDELVRTTLDWDALVWYARLHSVAPLFHHHLSQTSGYGEVPPPARRKLLALAHRAAYQNAFYAREHAVLTSAFDDVGVRAISPKGLPLVELVYGSHALRPLIDLLYLVARPQLDAAAKLIRKHGYEQVRRRALDEVPGWVCPQIGFVAEREIHLAVLLFGEPVGWARLHRIRDQEVFARATQAFVGGVATSVLSPEDLVIYLCLQADNHGYFNRVAFGSVEPVELLLAPWSNNRLVRFTDLYLSIRHFGNRVDWLRIVESARAGGVEEPVHLSLALTSALLGPAVPTEVAAELRTAVRHRLRGWLFVAVTRPDGQHASRLEGFVRRRWTATTARQQLRVIRLLNVVELAFPDIRTLRARYPSVPGLVAGPVWALHAGAAVGASAARFLSHGFRGLALRLRREFLPGGER
jgi:hypothetical protein